ncbi:nucleotide sugar dehydrogenase [Streptomyces sp. NPDC003038]|uniref:nucleotide sugar dehydrogenase n=1 Tax=unclassified Streptomyces TaxID=2593676 RepID=UPI0033AC1400
MRVGVVGLGYVGLTAALGLAEQGHVVIGVDSDPDRVALLAGGRLPFEEPGLRIPLAASLDTQSLSFTSGLGRITEPLDAVVIAVGSPPTPSGRPDLRQVTAALMSVLGLDPLPGLIVVKSTIPPGTSAAWLAGPLADRLTDRYVYSPEFLNQGAAIDDWRRPARLVAGLSRTGLVEEVKELYRGIDAALLFTDPTSAEVVKYASNAFLATKVSFVGDLITLCEGTGADIDDVLTGTGLDPRIGPAFLRAEGGYAGSCLPKDTLALRHWSRLVRRPLPVIEAVIAANQVQQLRSVRILEETLGPARLLAGGAVVAVLGLRYQPWSDDLRDAPCMSLVPELQTLGVRVRVFEPSLTAEQVTAHFPGIEVAPNLREAVSGAEAAIVLTDWPETINADWNDLAVRMAAPRVVVDTKNCLPMRSVTAAPLLYRSMGPRRADTGSAPASAPDGTAAPPEKAAHRRP